MDDLGARLLKAFRSSELDCAAWSDDALNELVRIAMGAFMTELARLTLFPSIGGANE